ncbi:glycoside hydrolase family 92 protein [Alternaria alternata]|nr:glycoside hydrolase family 92 protein [Alternaria alternata]
MGTRLLPVLVIARCIFAQDHIDYAQYVNPFIGTEGAIPGLACKTPNSPCAFVSDRF